MAISLMQVKDYFGYANLSAFSQDWKQLPESEREQIKSGIENGSLTY